jgi:hypothetical protein
MRWAGGACLGLAGLTAAVIAWPSARAHIDVSLSADQMQSAWVTLQSSAVLDTSPVPSLMLTIDLPHSVLKGREEQMVLGVDVSSEGEAETGYALAAEIISAEVQVTPRGESGQALCPGAAFNWTIVATHAPQASATLLVRLRRHSPGGAAEAERLVLARDIVLPVRTVAGLSAPAAKRVAVILCLGGGVLWIASVVSRTR